MARFVQSLAQSLRYLKITSKQMAVCEFQPRCNHFLAAPQLLKLNKYLNNKGPEFGAFVI
jgi:hypothetical protein